MHELKVGDRVRCAAFDGRRDCYAEGVVEELGTDVVGRPVYCIRTERIVQVDTGRRAWISEGDITRLEGGGQ